MRKATLTTDDDVALVRGKMREWADEHPRYAVFRPQPYGLLTDGEAEETSWGPWPEVGIALYKTARNAMREAGEYGLLLHFDFEQLRIVDASESLVTKGSARNEVGDSEFCERQAILWMQRADRMKAAGK